MVQWQNDLYVKSFSKYIMKCSYSFTERIIMTHDVFAVQQSRCRVCGGRSFQAVVSSGRIMIACPSHAPFIALQVCRDDE